ncbi:hypothetical protein AB0H83_05475 [Dactylosporangium sp. NPDC050688]|uniref:hypothetical protein n=1 Tax=Dactylosporangium sp. NPDC050688 TaxID=3157217 RepID=UPI00340F30E2
MSIGGWRLLGGASGTRTVAAVDFTLAKVRAQANFADLAPHLPPDCAVWGSDETGWPAAPGDARAHVAEWRQRSAALGNVHAVLGFCAGAALAGDLAARRARLVLFDPVTVAPGTVVEHYAAAVRRMGAEPDAPPDTGVEDLAEQYAVVARKALGEQGVPDSITADLCARVAANLRYLAMCAAVGLDGLRPDLVVLSRDHGLPEALRDSPRLRLDVSQEQLLAEPAAARAAVPPP